MRNVVLAKDFPPSEGFRLDPRVAVAVFPEPHSRVVAGLDSGFGV